MEPFVRRFIRASLAWLAVGVAIGVAMAVRPAFVAFRPAHVHANLLGFVSMMIFGVAYHVIPRFAGAPLHSRRLAAAHLWVANAGLAAMVAGFALRVHAPAHGAPLLAAGAVASAAGALTFVFNLWRTLDAAVPAGGPMVSPATLRRPSPRTAGATP